MVQAKSPWWEWTGRVLFAVTATGVVLVVAAMFYAIFSGQWKRILEPQDPRPADATVKHKTADSIVLSVEPLYASYVSLQAKVWPLSDKKAEPKTYQCGPIVKARDCVLGGLKMGTAYRIVLDVGWSIPFSFVQDTQASGSLEVATNAYQVPVPVNGRIAAEGSNHWRAFYTGGLEVDLKGQDKNGQIIYQGPGHRDWTYVGGVRNGLPDGDGKLESGTRDAACSEQVCSGSCAGNFVEGNLADVECKLALLNPRWARVEPSDMGPMVTGFNAKYNGNITDGSAFYVGPFGADANGKGVLQEDARADDPSGKPTVRISGLWKGSQPHGQATVLLPSGELREGEFADGSLVKGTTHFSISHFIADAPAGRHSSEFFQRHQSGMGIYLGTNDFRLGSSGGSAYPDDGKIAGSANSQVFVLTTPEVHQKPFRQVAGQTKADCSRYRGFDLLPDSTGRGEGPQRWHLRAEVNSDGDEFMLELPASRVAIHVFVHGTAAPRVLVSLGNQDATQRILEVSDGTRTRSFDLAPPWTEARSLMVLASLAYGKQLKNLATGLEENIENLQPLIVLLLSRVYACREFAAT
ncbi:hypothetical protein QTI24_21530 [Variovorax sp. J22P240]|uniref:hypothetical protein n=1 Tax=Variovorax sp. J22P240 TaxID=3053514 RepID=UPI002577E3BA|nr:hypothetical protein [Variovorax sp. J22P240]MDM0001203.1 hypothetical protein [Variovorax sp. J22P240]